MANDPSNSDEATPRHSIIEPGMDEMLAFLAPLAELPDGLEYFNEDPLPFFWHYPPLVPAANIVPIPSRAPNPPQIESSTSSSFADIDGEQVKRDASEAADKTSQKASETADKTSQKASETADKTSQQSKETAETLRQKAAEAADYTKQKSGEFGDAASKNYEKARKEAQKDGKKVKEDVKSEYNEVYENRDNPVVIANAVLMAATAVALGVGGYQKYKVGELDWQLAGAAGAVVGILGVGDYYLSQWLFQNKYPKK